jgi:uncharacterized protein (DUF934 family)
MSKRKIIKGQSIIEDSWSYLLDGESPPSESSAVVLSVDRYLTEADDFRAAGYRLGVRFEPHHTGRELGFRLDELDLVVIDFPKFTDGRGYTVARRLRSQLGYQGPLRAAGDVLPDQAFYLRRCGFDELDVRDDENIEDARSALATFSVVYQGDAGDPRPLWRRRA